MGRASQEAGPTKQYASNRSSSPSPKSSPGFISPGSMLNPHMLFGHPTRDGRASQKEAGEKTRKGRRRNAGDRSGEDNTVKGVRLPLTRTKNPSPLPGTHRCLALPTQPSQLSRPGPHPDLVPELLSLLSQLLQLTHGARPVGRGWGRLGAAGRGLGEAAPRRWPEAWGMQG